jgi:hypothetical protein
VVFVRGVERIGDGEPGTEREEMVRNGDWGVELEQKLLRRDV